MAGLERSTPAKAFGLSRVLDVIPCLPQAAEKLDNTLPIYSTEILIEVERLNIDSASFKQMEEQTGSDPKKIEALILENIKNRGKQHNAVTGSGGMLIGKIKQMGSTYKGPLKAKVGDRVASLVSLTLTPLEIKKIKAVHLRSHQLEVEGHAILFESSVAALLPQDLPQGALMAAMDVCGAPKLTSERVQKNNGVIILGAGGKAGILSCAAAREKLGKSGFLIGIEPHAIAASELDQLQLCDEVIRHDATDAVGLRECVQKVSHGKMGDVIINVTSVPGTEMASLLCAGPSAQIIFFSMATSFTRAALGAEGIGSDAILIIGNGYRPGHADFVIEILRKNSKLLDLFKRRYL